MKLIDPKSLYEARSPWFDVLHFTMDVDTARRLFKVEPYSSCDEGLGDFDCWAMECDCGLKLIFEFFYLGTGGTIYASEPVPLHVERHLVEWKASLERYEDAWFEKKKAEVLDVYSRKVPDLNLTELCALSYQVWRQGDDGNPVKIGLLTTKLDAECLVAELESNKHKQTYWITE